MLNVITAFFIECKYTAHFCQCEAM
jgi:hypothetical protein